MIIVANIIELSKSCFHNANISLGSFIFCTQLFTAGRWITGDNYVDKVDNSLYSPAEDGEMREFSVYDL